ncbi:MAG: DNA repair protein RecO [Lachnospiraceae bacterium]|nr:DNA repair protein RecO [Lachnospiraceae bacterium]
MDGLIKANGVVLIASPYKEYDTRLEILTEKIGRISAFARGSRRPNSSISAACLPFTFATFDLYGGKSAYNVHGAQITRHFEELAYDMDAMIYASYFSELLRYYTRENIPAEREIKLLFLSYSALAKKVLPPALIRIIFEMRLMLIEGEAIELSHCVGCGKSSPETKLNTVIFRQGGLLCEECMAKINPEELARNIKFTLSTDALYTLQYILSAQPQKLFAFNVKEPVIHELKLFMEKYFKVFVNHEFKSLKMLETF